MKAGKGPGRVRGGGKPELRPHGIERPEAVGLHLAASVEVAFHDPEELLLRPRSSLRRLSHPHLKNVVSQHDVGQFVTEDERQFVVGGVESRQGLGQTDGPSGE